MSKRDEPISWRQVFWVILSISLLPPIVYVAGYPLLGPNESSMPSTISRNFPNQFFARIYMPAGILESKLRGKTVVLGSYDPVDQYTGHLIILDP